MKKKFISLLLCLFLGLFHCIPFFAGNTIVAKIGDTEYRNHEQAWQEVQKRRNNRCSYGLGAGLELDCPGGQENYCQYEWP